jgi:hypothetical protein
MTKKFEKASIKRDVRREALHQSITSVSESTLRVSRALTDQHRSQRSEVNLACERGGRRGLLFETGVEGVCLVSVRRFARRQCWRGGWS